MLKHVVLFLIGLLVYFIVPNSVSVAAESKDSSSADSPSATAEPKPSLFIPHQLKLKHPDYQLAVQRVKFFSPAYGAFRGSNRLDRFEQAVD